jgi:hypothetical protein
MEDFSHYEIAACVDRGDEVEAFYADGTMEGMLQAALAARGANPWPVFWTLYGRTAAEHNIPSLAVAIEDFDSFDEAQAALRAITPRDEGLREETGP